ncbi:G-type lectin S-receptor-like serine/threonine-protein kinase LECRK1 isoform X2 [Silene latifolia]
MNDTGNFVLKSSSNDPPVWETFNFPTDTLLPGQVWDAGKEINSRMSESNFTKGRFQLRLLPDGNLVLNTRDLATDFAYGVYYETGTNNPPDNVGKQVVYSESGDMYVLREDGSQFDLIIQPGTLVSTKDYYQRATLNYNGVLTWYSYPRASTIGSGVDWSEIQSEPDNICNRIASYGGDFDSGACGYNSICNIDDNQKPVCKCPPNYSLMDPTDIIGSCEPDFKLDVCEKFEYGVNSKYELIQLKNTNWPSGDYARLNTSSEEECKNSCLNDCFCAAVIFSGSGCWKKKPPLSNGRHGGWEPSTAWLKVGLGNATSYPNNPPGEVKYKNSVVTTGVLGGSISINFILITAIVLIIFFKHKRMQSRGYKDHKRGSLLEHDRVHKFSYRKLESAANGFKEEIGRGSFGVVYKGTITTGVNSVTVAVKKLDRTFMGADKEFTAEVNAIGLTHHKNLVRFIGYCKEEDKRLLVYEYMPNGTVADYLFGDSRPSWLARIHIAQGVARGLLYLHEECTTQIIHCDIKPQNILVDDHYNARISDFGLAKLLVLNQSQTNTAVRGTKGYVAPEWFKNKPVSMKVDVYSFGVLLLEIVCCRRCVRMEQSADERAILTDWAFDCYQSGMLDSLVNDDMEALNDWPRLERFVKVGLWCIQEDPNLRPTMQRVNQMLDGVAEVPDPPCQTSFSAIVQV